MEKLKQSNKLNKKTLDPPKGDSLTPETGNTRKKTKNFQKT